MARWFEAQTTVAVGDGTNSCSAAVSAGSCQLTSTTAGLKTLVATYSGDPNFLFGSGATQHTVSTIGAVPRVPHRIAIPMIITGGQGALVSRTTD